MAGDDWDQFEAVPPATTALSQLQARGAVVTNGYRTADDYDRLKAEGYTPARNSQHNLGNAVDLVPGGEFKSLSDLQAAASQAFGPGAIAEIHNGTHVHVSVPGWHDAPDTTRKNEWDEFATVAPAEPQAPAVSAQPHAPATATGQVHDGDTFRLSTGDNARLFGADAYELDQTGQRSDGTVVPLGTEARDYMAGHLPSGPVDFTGQSTYGRPVVEADQSAVGLLRNGYGVAEPQYLRGSPAFPSYMEAERLARMNRLGGFGTNAVSPSDFRHGVSPFNQRPLPGTPGDPNSAVVMNDEPVGFYGYRPEVEKSLIAIWDDPKATPEQFIEAGKNWGLDFDPSEVRDKFAKRFDKKGNFLRDQLGQRLAAPEEQPRPLTNPGDGTVGAALRGFGDPVNMLDELGGVVDTLGVPDWGGPRETIWNSDRRFGDILWNNIDQNRSILGYDEKYHPYARLGGQIASAVAVPGFGVEGVGARAAEEALANGASHFAADAIAKKAVTRRLAAIGAGEGGVAGFGAGEGGPIDRLPSAVEGAAIGAVAAPVIGKAIEAATPLAQRGWAALGRLKNREVAAAAGDIPDAAVDVGPHGPIHYDLADNYPAALERLKADKTGEIPGAIDHPEIGPIDLVWGDGRYGLSKIVQQHPEVANDLPDIVEHLPVKETPADNANGKFVLEDATHRAVIAPDFDGVEKRWLVTAFERKRPGSQDAGRGSLSPDGVSSSADAENIVSSGDGANRTANMEADKGPSVESEPLQPSGRAGPVSDLEMGRPSVLETGPQPEDFTPAANRMSPGDVLPVPGNRVENMAEAERANPGRFSPVEAPDETSAMRVRNIQTRTGRTVKVRGPLDMTQALRVMGGVKDTGGELRFMGVTNKPRRLDFGSEHFLGKLIDNEHGMPLDIAAHRLWEAGYFPGYRDVPTEDDLLTALRNESMGQRNFHPDDYAEVENFRKALSDRSAVDKAAYEGSPLVEDRTSPVTQEDIAANQPPVTAYEDLPRLVDKVGNINLKNIRNAADISRAMKRLEDEFSMGAKSPVSHGETEALAREMGMTVKDLLASREGRAFNHAEATAARALLAKSYDEMVTLARKAFNGTDEDKLLFQKAVANVAAIHNKVSGLTREAGRALSAFRIGVDQNTVNGKALKQLLEAHGGADNIDKLAEGIIDLERNGVGPGGITRFAAEAVKPKWSDKLLALWMFSLLSGPKTHAVNIVSNTITALGQIPEYGTAALIGSARAGLNRLRGKAADDRILYSELGPRAFGLLQGAKEGLISAKAALRTGETSDAISKVEMSRQQEAFTGLAGHVIHAPTRLLSAEDEFFKSVARRMETNALAVRQARSEGLRGAALDRRIAELSANPTEEMMDKAFDYARYLTFQRPLGEKGQALMNLVGKSKLLRIPLPFIRTPTNLLKFAVERSPAAPLLREVREDFKAGGSRRDLALAKMMLGSGFGMAISEMAANGFITGSGPADENTVRQLRADGWAPYSVKIGNRYVSYQRLDPLATTMGVFADFVDLQSAMTEKQRDHIGTLLTTSIIQNLGNKTWLSGLADAFEVYSDPQRASGPYLNRLAASVVPSGLAQATQVIDPTLREARSMLDAIKARIPGLSSTLLPKRDAYGRPITREGSIGPDIISPFAVSTRKHDPVIQAVIDSGAHIDVPSRQVRGKDLSDQDYDRYQALSGRYMYSDLKDAVSDPEWKTMDPADRKAEIESIKNNARADARYDLFGDDSEQ